MTTLIDQLILMATYNQWMNEKIYTAARQLPEQILKQDRQAFFSSIFGTLNHLCVGDTIWLKRFATHHSGVVPLQVMHDIAMPPALNDPLFDHFEEMQHYRQWLDTIILNWISQLNIDDVDQAFSYTNTKGIASQKNLYFLLVHFFNRQTHHRGQVTTLLTQADVDIGITDLLAVIPSLENV